MTPRDEQQLRASLGLPAESGCAGSENADARREHASLVRMYDAFDREHEHHKQELLAMLPDGAPPRAEFGASRLGRFGGFVMHSIRKHKFAAVMMPAACLMIVAFFVINTTSQTAFAKVVERLREIHAARCKVTLKMLSADNQPLAPDSTGEFVLTDQYGSRQDMYAGGNLMSSSYFLPDGSMVMIVPATKTYQRIGPSEATTAANSNALQNWLNLLKKSDGEVDRDLGSQTIDGAECVGFEVDGARFGMARGNDGKCPKFTVWVERGGDLPVLVELRMSLPTVSGSLIMQYADFEWNPDVDVASLTPPSADGMNEINLAMPEASEKTFIDALRDYAEVAGEYPAEFDPATVAAVFVAKLMGSGKLGDPSSKEFQQQLGERAMVIGAGCGFYQGLFIRKLEPQYFGASVKPGDATAILASWNAEGGGRRVIYGDLRAETVLGDK